MLFIISTWRVLTQLQHWTLQGNGQVWMEINWCSYGTPHVHRFGLPCFRLVVYPTLGRTFYGVLYKKTINQGVRLNMSDTNCILKIFLSLAAIFYSSKLWQKYSKEDCLSLVMFVSFPFYIRYTNVHSFPSCLHWSALSRLNWMWSIVMAALSFFLWTSVIVNLT